MDRLTPKFPIPTTYNEFSGYAMTFVLQIAIVVAITNLVWNVYRYRRTQSSINGAYVVVLFWAEDAVQKGIVADNVAETRYLSRDVQGNLEESNTLLKKLKEDRQEISMQVGKFRKVHSTLNAQVAALEAKISDLEAVKKGLQTTNTDLQTTNTGLQNTKKELQNLTHLLSTQFETLGAHLNTLPS